MLPFLVPSWLWRLSDVRGCTILSAHHVKIQMGSYNMPPPTVWEHTFQEPTATKWRHFSIGSTESRCLVGTKSQNQLGRDLRRDHLMKTFALREDYYRQIMSDKYLCNLLRESTSSAGSLFWVFITARGSKCFEQLYSSSKDLNNAGGFFFFLLWLHESGRQLSNHY